MAPRGVFPAGELVRARGGLLDAADVVNHGESDMSWAAGQYAWDTTACPVDLIVNDFCTTGVNGQVAAAPGATPLAWPFGVISKYTCLTLGNRPEVSRKIALAQNEAGTQKAIEHELWTGQLATAAGHLDAPYLSSNSSGDMTPGNAAVSIKLGIAALEQALGDCGLGVKGVIHMTRSAASIGADGGVLGWTADGKHLETVLGTRVISGVGYDPHVERSTTTRAQADYPDTSQPRILPASQWMYATGPVTVHLGEAQLLDDMPAFAMRSNEITYMVARPAAVYWDSCCTFAAHVALTA